MLSFLVRHPPRTRISHLYEFTLDGGRSAVAFKPPGDRYLVVNRLPPADDGSSNNNNNNNHSSLAPPLHRHVRQSETFRVVRGAAGFALGRTTREARRRRPPLVAAAGRVVVVPRGHVHAFRNAGGGGEELVVEFALDPASRETDEAYFRNVWGYRDDCNKAGLPRNPFQTLLFMHRGGVVMALPGPDAVSRAAGLLLNYVGGVLVGKMLLGFRDSYPEYYHGASS